MTIQNNSTVGSLINPATVAQSDDDKETIFRETTQTISSENTLSQSTSAVDQRGNNELALITLRSAAGFESIIATGQSIPSAPPLEKPKDNTQPTGDATAQIGTENKPANTQPLASATITLEKTKDLKPKDGSIKLNVPYFNQRDNTNDGANGDRSCYSSSSAMLAKFALGDKAPTLNGVKPSDPNWDAAYLERMSQFGDTTSHAAQTAGLRSIGVNSEFRQMDLNDLDAQLAKGKPVAIGILHHGSINAPSGGGHWLVVTGKTAGGDYIVNDPYGKLDQRNGGYDKNTREGAGENLGEGQVYSRETLQKRWTVEGGKSGYARVLT